MVSIELTESKILYFLLMFIFRIVVGTYLFNWCFGSINAMEMLTVFPDCSRKLKACLEEVRKMNWRFYSDQCQLSFLLCIYWSLKCTPEGTKDIWALWLIKDKRCFPLFFRRRLNFCVSPRWSPPESSRLIHWKLSFSWGNVTLNNDNLCCCYKVISLAYLSGY